MAVLAAAALLDELMGRNRNIAPNEKGKELNWEDPEYCKFFMVKFCPHDLFVNTKADLGSCTKVHDEEARKLFEESKPIKKLHCQEEFIRFCTSMLNDVERKIVKGKQRLALSGKGVGDATSISTPVQTQKNQEQIDLLNERINGLVEEAEQAGNDGNVEQAQGLMKLCDQLKEERDALRKQNENSHWSATAELAAAQEKLMEVCEVCGAFLIVGDAQQRIEDHLTGKQHMGYARLKAAIDEVTNIVQTVRDDKKGGRFGGLGSGPNMDDRRHRDRERGRRDRDRSRSGQRDRKEREVKEREVKEREGGKEREGKEREGKDREGKEREGKEREGKERDAKEREAKEREGKDRDVKERRERGADRKDRDKERRESREGREKKDDRERDRDRRHRSDRDSGRDGRGDRNQRHSHRR